MDLLLGNSSIFDKKFQPLRAENPLLQIKFDEEKKHYERCREKIYANMHRFISDSFIDIRTIKVRYKSRMERQFESWTEKLRQDYSNKPVTGVAASLLIGHIKEIVIIKQQKTLLMHAYCKSTLHLSYNLLLFGQMISLSHSLRLLGMLFPIQSPLLDLRPCYGVEAMPYFFSNMSRMQDELRTSVESPTNRIKDTFDINSTLLTIPSTEDIAVLIQLFMKDSKPPTEIAGTSIPISAFEEKSLQNPITIQCFTQDIISIKKPIEYLSLPYNIINSLSTTRNLIILELVTEMTRFPLHQCVHIFVQVQEESQYLKYLDRISAPKKASAGDKVEALLNNEIMKDRNKVQVMNALKGIARKLKITDYTLFKTCSMKLPAVLEYFDFYLKNKMMCLTEALYRVFEEVAEPNKSVQEKIDSSTLSSILSALNYTSSQKLGKPTFSTTAFSVTPRFFRFYSFTFPGSHETSQGMSLHLSSIAENTKNYNDHYAKPLINERGDDGEILSQIVDDLKYRSRDYHVFAKIISSVMKNDEIRKSLSSHLSIVEGRAQVDPILITENNNIAEEEEVELPIEVAKIDELKGTFQILKEKLQLRRFRIALMYWYNNKTMSDITEYSVLKQTFTEKTFLLLMNMKEEIKQVADKINMNRNARIRQENAAEIEICSSELQKGIIQKGIE